jgi:serine/threonine protein kinase
MTLKEQPNLNSGLMRGVSTEAKDLIEKMLEKLPLVRLNIKEVIDHPWFNDVRLLDF